MSPAFEPCPPISIGLTVEVELPARLPETEALDELEVIEGPIITPGPSPAVPIKVRRV
jgi:hypothetical protein